MKNFVVVGLAFGDEGKGSIVDYLTHKSENAPLIVRFNGACQAGHNVVTPDGKHHTFSQFGSGMFRDGTETHLSKFMLINPLNMIAEAAHLTEVGVRYALQRTTIAASSPIITPYQIALNHLREMARGEQRHGSCGQGVGELMADTLLYPEMILRYGDLIDPVLTECKLSFWRDFKETQAEEFGPHPETDIFNDDSLIPEVITVYQHVFERALVVPDDYLDGVLGNRSVIFEGAQGVLLDETYGFNPYTTWSTTTPKNARTLLGDHQAETVGVVRTYYTRHGAGPFPTEDPDYNNRYEPHNTTGEYQGDFRAGTFDEALFDYALRVCEWSGGIQHLAVTHASKASLPYLTNYRLPFDISTIENPTELDMAAMTMSVTSINNLRYMHAARRDISVIAAHVPHCGLTVSYGPTRNDKENLRTFPFAQRLLADVLSPVAQR